VRQRLASSCESLSLDRVGRGIWMHSFSIAADSRNAGGGRAGFEVLITGPRFVRRSAADGQGEQPYHFDPFPDRTPQVQPDLDRA